MSLRFVHALFMMLAMIEPVPAAPYEKPGMQLAKGVARHLRDMGFMSLPEVTLPSGLRVDVMALGPRGEIWIVECKSCRADYRADGKWPGYTDWADRFFFAVPTDFPHAILPEETGLMIADAYGAEVLRMPATCKLAPARRKSLTLRFARLAAARQQAINDPGGAVIFG
jgi:hypothetical protein